MSYNPPVKNAEYIFYVALVSQADTKLLKGTPTIAAGDFQISTNGGSLSNLDTTPTVSPAGSASVKVTLSADEMNADNVWVRWIDASGSEWCSDAVCIQPIASGQQFNDLATSTAQTTAQSDLDLLTGADGATLATSQPNYAPATATALATAQTDLDTLTGADGATLATAQGNYAPAKAGDAMGLSDGAITAAKIADAAIDNATFASDVGSTTYASNIIALAARKALDAVDLDHLIEVTAGSEEATAGSYLDQIMHKSASQTFDDSTDSLEAIRDAIRDLPQTAAAAQALSTAGKLQAVAYTTYSEAISGDYTSGKTASKVTMTIKQNELDPDSAAVLQANSTDGLAILNGSSSVTAAQAAIAYSQGAGTVTPTITDAAMVLIGMRHNLVYDIKIHYSDGESSRFSYGEFVIAATATRTVT